MARTFARRYTADLAVGLLADQPKAPKGKGDLDLVREVTIIPTAPGGKVKLVDSDLPLVVDAVSAADVIRVFNDREIDVPLDFEHASVKKASRGDAAPAAGWVKALRYVEATAQRPGGLMATIDFSATAAEMVDRGEYKYLSPTVIFDKRTRRVRRLHSVALTNTPAIHHMVAIAASDIAALLTEERPMPEPQGPITASPEQLVGEIKAALEGAGVAIAPDATLEGVLAAVLTHLKGGGGTEGGEVAEDTPEHKEEKAIAASVREALKIDAKSDSTTVLKALRDAVTPAGAGNAGAAMTELQTEVRELKAQLKTGKAETLLALAESSGHVNPKDKAQFKWATEFAASDPTGFEAWMGANKPTASPPQGATRPPLGTGFRAASDTGGDPADKTSADQKLIRDHCVTHKCLEREAITALQQTLLEPLTARGLRKDAAMAELSDEHPHIFMGCDEIGVGGSAMAGAPANVGGFVD